MRSLKLLWILVFLFASCLLAFAQTPTGIIEGTVTDPQGNVVAGATVSIKEASTGRSITVSTSDAGTFASRALPPGVYSVKVEKNGFSTASADKVIVQVGQVARADIGLKIGSASETVQVDIGSTDLQVDTVRQTLDGVVTAQQIENIPMNERNFLDLATLQPGVTVVDGGNIDPTKVNAFRAVRVNGGSGTGTRVQIEGIDVTDETVGTTVANFSTDSVQEFNLQRSSFDLSTSLTTSGAISIASRTGGNKFSGSGFYFKQDDAFDARPDFVAVKPEFNRDQTGYRFGGPIWKEKIFFFSNFERFNQADFSNFTSGDFPQFNGDSSLPIVTRYALNRVDFDATGSLRIFYLHNYNDDVSTGGTLRSPFQNIDWTNTHVVGVNYSGSRFTHSARFGLVNFNNRIASNELPGFEFPTQGGTPVQINVGDISYGPNSLAPQQTYQNNYQGKYDGSAVLGDHVIRYGGEVNRIILGGFANFAGPMTAVGKFTSSTSTDPLDYLLQDFFVGPNAGFFTARPAHGLPHGGKYNTRLSWYVGDLWKVWRNFSLNFGVRHNYDTNFFADPDVPRLPELDVYGAGYGDAAKYPKTAFSPQVGFAWDPWSNGKTSIRGGFNLAYEANIFNNSLFDEFARITTGIGPTQLSTDLVVGPDGTPINVAIPGCDPAATAQGDYRCLRTLTIAAALPYISQINDAVQTAYGNLGSNYDPTSGPSEFANTEGVTFGGQFPGNYKIPYSMQFNIGFQHELMKNHIISVDYVRQRSVGLPLLLQDYENRLDARFFDEAEARVAIATLIGGAPGDVNPTSIQAYLDAHPGTDIADFGLTGDLVWPGRTSLNRRARLAVGGFSTYSGLQISMNGRFGSSTFEGASLWGQQILKGMTYGLGYALASNKATSGVGRPEFIANTTDNIDRSSDYGPSGLDRRHNLTISASMELIGGFRLDQVYRFQTSAPQSLTIPNNRAQSGLFTSDINGDGGTGSTPRADLLPGTNIGAFGRSIGSWAELNDVISAYNSTGANRLTPAGLRLVDAGLFTEDQLRSIGAVTPVIPLVPLDNPFPFKNLFTADFRLTRPIRIWKENWILEPSLSVFNVFNHAALNSYAGLAIPNVGDSEITNFGTLNFNYATSDDVADLAESRGIRNRRRQLQFGIRFSF